MEPVQGNLRTLIHLRQLTLQKRLTVWTSPRSAPVHNRPQRDAALKDCALVPSSFPQLHAPLFLVGSKYGILACPKRRRPAGHLTEPQILSEDWQARYRLESSNPITVVTSGLSQ